MAGFILDLAVMGSARMCGSVSSMERASHGVQLFNGNLRVRRYRGLLLLVNGKDKQSDDETTE